MSKLYFRIGEMRGFTAIDLADKKEGYTNPIRELLQNSLDASREAGNDKCEINIYIETILKSDIPNITEYEKVLNKAIRNAEEQGSYNANSKQRVAAIQNALQKERLKILMFSDNGAGMSQKQLDAILTGGVSIKGNEESGGSFGVGNLSSYLLSSLRYVLYATKQKDGNGREKVLFTGSPILAGHRDGKSQRGNRGRIVAEKPKNQEDPKFIYPDNFPAFISPKMENIDRGTMVVVLGLTEKWGADAEYAIASNFFLAIARDELNVSVHEEEERKISCTEIEQLIGGKKEGRRARGENILSGRTVYQAWQTINAENAPKKIKLSNSDTVNVFVTCDDNVDSAIVLIRNGMVIARHDSMLSDHMAGLRKNRDFKPFTAIIDVDNRHAPKLFKLIKNAESPYHNRLQKNILDKKDEKKLKNLFEELSKEIKKHLERIDEKPIILKVLPVPNRAEAQADGAARTSGQNKQAKPEPVPPKPPTPTPEPVPPGPVPPEPRPEPIVTNRILESRNAVRYKDEGKKWTVKLRITPNNQENAKDDVWLSICLGEDHDDGASRTYLNFEELELDEKKINIPNSTERKKVNLGRLEKEKQYDIVAKVSKPEGFGEIRAALVPVLGLRQQKTTKNTEEQG